MEEKENEIISVREFPYKAIEVFQMRNTERFIKIWW
jgi:hypothetical protein